MTVPGFAVPGFARVLPKLNEFREGLLVTLWLEVPPCYPQPDTVLITIEITEIHNGFIEVVTSAGEGFYLDVVPEPATFAMLAMGALALPRRRRA